MKLLALEASDESWKIAKDLMFIESYHIHGCQLLSKKLTNPILFSNAELSQI